MTTEVSYEPTLKTRKRKGKPDNGTPTLAESKSDKFIRLASRRMTKALKYICSLKPLANTTAYSHTEEQRDAMMSALRQAVEDVAVAFIAKDNSQSTFTF